MRKTLLVIVVLFTTAQVFAATVTLEVNDIGDGWASIRYSADANVSAFGLKVTADSGAIFTDIDDYNVGECTASQKGYGIFPGTIDINESTGVVDGNGTPIAPSWDPCDHVGPTGLYTNTLILEMGALYVEGNEPDTNGTLIKVQVDSSCTVCVEGEPIRGNIVMTDGTAVEANDCESIMLGCTVPDVLAMDLTGATTAIGDADLNVGDVTYECNDFEAADQVLSQEPAGETVVECFSDVDLVVSTGPAGAVPNLVDMNEGDVLAALEACDLTVGTVTAESNDTVVVGRIISQNPGVGATPGCGSPVDVVRSLGSEDCYSSGDPNYTEWTNVGRPVSWCFKYQCYGDGDGIRQGNPLAGYYRVGSPDLNLLISGWKNLNYVDPVATPWIGADFDKTEQGNPLSGYYRVGSPDLNIVIENWKDDSAIPLADPNCGGDIDLTP